MGKGGRIACIFTPYLLTIAGLICLIIVGLGATKSDGKLSEIYFVKADLKDLKADPSSLLDDLLPLGKGLKQAEADGDLHDFYHVGLWNYCYGDYKDGDYKITDCTDRKKKFWFNPAEVWGIEDEAEEIFPDALEKGLSAYKQVAEWLFIAYVVAVVATAVQLVVGISAIFSRWGSLATTICSSVSSVFILATAITATAMYGALVGAINTGLKPFEINASMGKNMFIALWLAVAFAMASGTFWLFSVCCCSGRSPFGHQDRKGRRGTVAEKAPYTYERVASPYGGQAESSVPLNPMPAHHQQNNMAYEPFRSERV